LTVSDGYLEQIRSDVRINGKRVFHFKNGTSKEYPVATKEQLDSYRVVFGGDSQLDDFGENVIVRSSRGSDVFVPPVLDVSDSFCRSFGYEIIGHGQKLDNRCNVYAKTIGCPHVESHLEHVGLIPTHKCHHHCYNYRCPETRFCALVCYFWGACVREAQHIDQRLLYLSAKSGKSIEAGMISVPKRLYGAPEEVIRKWTILAAKKRGLEGANLICHPMRYASSTYVDGKFHLGKFYYAHHYHFLGTFKESYDICRECLNYKPWNVKSVRNNTGYGNHGGKACLECEHFEGLTRKLYKKDGFVMKVFDKRKSFFKTAAYELSHSGFKIGAKRVHVSTWFGSFVGVKVPYVRRKMVCPESGCKSNLVSLWYSGNYEIVKDSKSPFYQRDSWMPLMEEGKIVWNEVGITSGDFVNSSSGRISGGG